jgi:hypothetical protein
MGWLKSRVIVFQGFSQKLAVDMGINLGGGNTRVTEHFLYSPQIGSSFYQVGGERMPEAMGGNGFGDSRFSDKIFEDQEDHHPRQAGSSVIEKNNVFVSGLSS